MVNKSKAPEDLLTDARNVATEDDAIELLPHLRAARNAIHDAADNEAAPLRQQIAELQAQLDAITSKADEDARDLDVAVKRMGDIIAGRGKRAARSNGGDGKRTLLPASVTDEQILKFLKDNGPASPKEVAANFGASAVPPARWKALGKRVEASGKGARDRKYAAA